MISWQPTDRARTGHRDIETRYPDKVNEGSSPASTSTSRAFEFVKHLKPSEKVQLFHHCSRMDFMHAENKFRTEVSQCKITKCNHISTRPEWSILVCLESRSSCPKRQDCNGNPSHQLLLFCVSSCPFPCSLYGSRLIFLPALSNIICQGIIRVRRTE